MSTFVRSSLLAPQSNLISFSVIRLNNYICSICVAPYVSTIYNIRHEKRIVQNMHTMYVNQGIGSIHNSTIFDSLDLTDKMLFFQFYLSSITTPSDFIVLI